MRFEDIPGWFMPIDQAGFAWTLEFQNRIGQTGNLVELGVFKGKSAVVIGKYPRGADTFTVCDLFEDITTHSDVDASEQRFFRANTPARSEFERNYLAFHPTLPHIVQGLTSQITAHVAPESVRFMHIDAGHTYEAVREDIDSARKLMGKDGVIAFDDWRKAGTPGVSAAMWEAILNEGLRPIFLTEFKFYATWGDPLPLQADIAARAQASGWAATAPVVMVRDMPVIHLHRRG